MKTTLSTLLIALLALPATASAEDLPTKAPLGKYSSLWVNSPFTSRPPPPAAAEPAANPLEDYALVGVSPVTEGFRITLINRTNPEERIIIDPNKPNQAHGFKVLGIDRKPGRPLSTTVKLSSGNVSGTVGFEQELLTLTPPPAAAAVPVQQPGVLPNQPPAPNAAGTEGRRPRPRVVQPPQPANGQQGNRTIPGLNPRQPQGAQQPVRPQGTRTMPQLQRSDRRR